MTMAHDLQRSRCSRSLIADTGELSPRSTQSFGLPTFSGPLMT